MMCINKYLLVCFILVAPIVMILAQSEICNNGIDDDGDQLIDCFDPDCCSECADHYFFDCDTLCDAFQLKDSIVLSTLWRFSSGEWDRRNTPLIGNLGTGNISILGLSSMLSSSTSNRNLLLVNGQDGSLQNNITTPSIANYAQSIGMVDLEGDGSGEIIAGVSNEAANPRRIFCFAPNGTILWRSDGQFGYSDADVNMSPQFVDFNEDGLSEIYFGNQVFSGLDGALLVQGGSTNNIGLQSAQNPLYRFYATTAADVLPDSYCAECQGPELIAGNQVFAVDLDNEIMRVVAEQNTSDFGDGLTSVADMNGDGNLDIVVAQRIGNSVNIWIWDPLSGNLIDRYIHPPTLPNSFSGGSSVALLTDIDRDEDVDIVFSTSQELVALENNGMGMMQLAWVTSTNDLTGRSGPVAFDFDGNGFPEVVHRGQNFLRVVSSIDGEVLDSVDCYSPTFFDKAVVANIDDDPAAEIICSCGDEVRAYTSGYSQWSSTRPVWNQMHYYNTHIQDDLTVPQFMQSMQYPELTTRRPLNRFLEQYSQPEKPTSDLYFERIRIVCANGMRRFSATICNQGDVRVPTNIYLSIYADDPTQPSAQLVWSDQLQNEFAIQQCRPYVFPIPDSIESDTIFFTINVIPGKGRVDTTSNDDFVAIECTYHNNIELFDLQPYNQNSVELGNDTLICPEASIVLDAGDQYLYEWSNGTMEDSLLVNTPGMYSVTVTDDCGNIAQDSIQVSISVLPDPGLPNDTTLCLGDTLEFTGPMQYDSLYWHFDGMLQCANCDDISLTVLDSGILKISAYKNDCIRMDSVNIEVLETAVTMDTLYICPFDSISVFGERVAEGTYSQTYSNTNICDSVSIITVLLLEEIEYTFTSDTLCPDDMVGGIQFTDLSSGLQIQWEDGNSNFNRNDLMRGYHTFTLEGMDGCQVTDSVRIVATVSPLEDLSITQPSCNLANGRMNLQLTTEDPQVFLDGELLGRGSILLDNLSPGDYNLQVLYDGCSFDTLLQFNENGLDSLLSKETIEVAVGDTLVLGSEFTSIISDPLWQSSTGSISCDSCLPLTIIALSNATYELSAVDAAGCEISKVYEIRVKQESPYYTPNIFTPNGDNINDVFTFYSRIPIESVDQVLIYDRWGSLVYEGRELQGQEVVLWDGTYNGSRVDQGTYVYYLQFTDLSGRTIQIGGSVTVVY